MGKPSKPYEGRPADEDPEDQDLETEGEYTENEDEGEEGEEGGQENGKGKGKADSEAEQLRADLERTQNELKQSKKDRIALQRQVNDLNAKLTKLKGDSDEDPEDLATKLAATESRLTGALSMLREQQRDMAIRDFIATKYPDYQGSVDYISPKVLLDDDSIDEDSSLYDTGLLKDEVERQVKEFVRRNPRTGSAGGNRATGGEGSPARGAGGDLKRKTAEDAAKELRELDSQFGGVLSRIAGR